MSAIINTPNTVNIIFLSIIVPAYNAEKYIENCVESLIQDTSFQYEIIIIDDGSTDNTSTIIRRLLNEYPNIKYIKKENGGVSTARNFGLENANGEHILFVDADDSLKPGTLQRIYNDYLDTPFDLIAYTFTEIIDETCRNPLFFKDSFQITNGDMTTILKKVAYNPEGRYFSHPYVRLFSKKIIDDYRIRFRSNVRLHEDQIFNLEYISRIKTFRYINEPIYIRPMHSDSAMGSRNIQKVHYCRQTIDELYKTIDILNGQNYDIEKDIMKLIVQISTSAIKELVYKNMNIDKATRKQVSSTLLMSASFRNSLLKLTLCDYSSAREKINYLLFKNKLHVLYQIYYRVKPVSNK